MIVVDASVATKWVIPEEHSDRALALVTNAADTGQTLVAPPLLPIEVANALRKRMVREGLALADADRLMARFSTFPVTLTLPEDLSRQELAIAEALGLPAVYDAHYVALAERLDCDLGTDDRRLLRLVGSSVPYVRAIGDYALDAAAGGA